jgi:voltage-gated sodium channel
VLTTKLYGDSFPEMFGTIGASLYTLFQVMTLEGWSGDVVRPVMAQYPYAWAVFLPYIIVVTFAVLNLFIGIVVDAMQQQSAEAKEEVIEVTRREYDVLIAEIRSLREEVRRARGREAGRS